MFWNLEFGGGGRDVVKTMFGQGVLGLDPAIDKPLIQALQKYKKETWPCIKEEKGLKKCPRAEEQAFARHSSRPRNMDKVKIKTGRVDKSGKPMTRTTPKKSKNMVGLTDAVREEVCNCQQAPWRFQKRYLQEV